MERDFMGLVSNDSVSVKEEFVEGSGEEDSGFGRSSGVLWPLSNKVPAVPNSISLKSDQDKKSLKMISSSNIFEAMCRRQSGCVENFGGATMKQLPGVDPLVVSQSVLPPAAVMSGKTGQRINSIASGFPAQMTIFYGGTVSVFDAISPEKVLFVLLLACFWAYLLDQLVINLDSLLGVFQAQAIFILAGNGGIPLNVAQSKLQIQPPASELPQTDPMMVHHNSPYADLPSPMSVSSHPINQSGVPAAAEDVKLSTTLGMSTTLIGRLEMPRVIPSIGSIAASAMMSSALPQARRASLARFLEKRKERVMNSSLYNMSKMGDRCATPESNGIGFSATSEAISTAASANKDNIGGGNM